MRNILFGLILLMWDFGFSQNINDVTTYTIPSGGATPSITVNYPFQTMPQLINVVTNGATTLSGGYTLSYSTLPPTGVSWQVYFDASQLTASGQNVVLFGQNPLDSFPQTTKFYIYFWVANNASGSATLYSRYLSNLVQLGTIISPVNFTAPVTFSTASVKFTGLPQYASASQNDTLLAWQDDSATVLTRCKPWVVCGNSGLSNANFVGNIDTPAVNFRVNNQVAGVITYGLTLGNTSLGWHSLASNTGVQNTGFGNAALYGATSGNYNTAIGTSALGSGSTGSNNTAVGVNSLTTAVTGQGNTGIGKSALESITSGNANTGTGVTTLYSLTTGSYNTAAGDNSGGVITSGSSNTCIGTGSANTTLVTGSYNTFIGTSTDAAASTTSYGISLGYNAVSSTNQLVVGNVRVASFPYMTSAIGDVLTDTSGTGDFIPQPPFGLTGTTFTPVTGDSVTVSKGKNTVNPSGTIANFTLILPASPTSWQAYEFSFLQAVTTLHWSHRLSGGTVSAGIPTAATQYQTMTVYWNPTLSEWILF